MDEMTAGMSVIYYLESRRPATWKVDVISKEK
jgi:hypothetical protein